MNVHCHESVYINVCDEVDDDSNEDIRFQYFPNLSGGYSKSLLYWSYQVVLVILSSYSRIVRKPVGFERFFFFLSFQDH